VTAPCRCLGLGAGCWVLGAGECRVRGAGCWVLGGRGWWVPGGGCWVLVGAGRRVVGAGCWVVLGAGWCCRLTRVLRHPRRCPPLRAVPPSPRPTAPGGGGSSRQHRWAVVWPQAAAICGRQRQLQQQQTPVLQCNALAAGRRVQAHARAMLRGHIPGGSCCTTRNSVSKRLHAASKALRRLRAANVAKGPTLTINRNSSGARVSMSVGRLMIATRFRATNAAHLSTRASICSAYHRSAMRKGAANICTRYLQEVRRDEHRDAVRLRQHWGSRASAGFDVLQQPPEHDEVAVDGDLGILTRGHVLQVRLEEPGQCSAVCHVTCDTHKVLMAPTSSTTPTLLHPNRMILIRFGSRRRRVW
jgi:hypothetical protein